MNIASLQERARTWMAQDPDPVTVGQTEEMLTDPAALQRFFGARLQFGTAGLRGPIGPGPGGMNRANVRWVTAGLAAYVNQHVSDAGGIVVVGFDGRHNSDVFAEDTARVLAGAGLTVLLFDEVVPTPVLAHAVVFCEAAAGVMVTASHNPPQDNGYKVYWSNGAQIIPPHDTGISDAIDAIPSLDSVVVPPLSDLRAAGNVLPVPDLQAANYLERVLALRVHPDVETDLTVVYTAMHGVGTATLKRVMGAAGYAIELVAEQAQPDGDFPTVAFPNPEEPGALDLAFEKARAVGADLVVANDPDADRLAVVIPDPQGENGWRALTGNQVGCLLAEDLLTHGPSDDARMVATTIVSSTMLSRIATAHDAVYTECLTGFKWIANAAIPFDANGGRFVIGYEEALGYSAGDVVRDKDGISAALLFCDFAAQCRADGRSVLNALEALYQRYGVHASKQVSIKHPGMEGQKRIDAILASLREERIEQFDGIPVSARTDVLAGVREDYTNGTTAPVDLPASNVLAWHLEDGSRILARPSGTEPKVKFYFEVVEPMVEDDSLALAEDRANQRMAALEAAFLARLD